MTKQTDSANSHADLSDEIQQAMDEAEAAVSALDGDAADDDKAATSASGPRTCAG